MLGIGIVKDGAAPGAVGVHVTSVCEPDRARVPSFFLYATVPFTATAIIEQVTEVFREQWQWCQIGDGVVQR